MTRASRNGQRPVALDLYCGAGGVSMGLWQAGFEPVGLDIDPAPLKRYPFTSRKGDATDVDLLIELVETLHPVLIFASPPCQGYSHSALMHDARRSNKRNYRLIARTRDLLEALDIPFVIENVQGAAQNMYDPIMLCGSAHPFVCAFGDIAFLRPVKDSSCAPPDPSAITGGSSTTSHTSITRATRRACFRYLVTRVRESAETSQASKSSINFSRVRSNCSVSQWALTGCPSVICRKPYRRHTQPSSADSF